MLSSTEAIHGEKIGRIVATKEGPTFFNAVIRLDPSKHVRPGELVISPILTDDSKKQFMVLRISDAREHNEYENPLDSQVRDMFDMDSPRGREDLLRKFVLATAQPLELIEEKADGTWLSEDPHALVSSGAEVFCSTSGVVENILGFANVNEPTSIHIGEVVGNSGIKVAFDANKVLPRHMLVVGSTGTGKSYLLGRISEELKDIGVRHVNIDVHGEMVEATKQLNGQSLLPGKNLTVKLSSLSEPEVLEMLPLYNELHIDIAIKAFSNLKKIGKDFGVSEFKDESIKVSSTYATQPRTADLMKARIDVLNSFHVIGKGYDWIENLKDDGSLINIDCREISSHKELKTIVGAVARELMNLRKNHKIKQLVLSMDEAHLFLPSGESSPSSQVLGELIRFGRHHGVGLIIASQSPNDIDRRIAKITNTRFFFAIEPTELSSVGGLLGDTPESIIKNLPRLKTGTCLLVGTRDTIKHPQIIQIGQRVTKDGGETPRMI